MVNVTLFDMVLLPVRNLLLVLLLLFCTGFSGRKEEGGAIVLPADLRNGDIIFLQSSSRQSSTLEEATHSRWTHTGIILRRDNRWMVAEAAATVKYTPIEEFIGNGKGHRFVTKRLEKSPFGSTDAGPKLAKQVARFLGRPYDIHFKWDDETIYCSELVWKVYQPFVSLSKPQRMRDMDLAGPQAKRMIEERYTRKGQRLNPDETVVTPAAIFNSPRLVQVYDSRDHRGAK
ncbi:hypothetical protein M1B72_11050 [Geomonas paludis]|uniref:Peptidoglycan peptidase n=1 Tax=Geomonas paludis TaxID=2740185 RepID=A0A6V8MU50_9BACT|nr:YiiX/YebB-like N1pC/P60 family cysteine hydrolase [Geomonas paludis]UPU38220.1 hypothetical protein M1B72_11050 [Geomonas paludis]GFO63247.1 hypothetical protein GMPD_11660 [Geomonas paludis]